MAKDKEVELTPTPPLGCEIYYYVDPRREEKVPGHVVAIEDVGRVAVSCMMPNGATLYKRGVMHMSHPDMKSAGPQSRNGAWTLQDWRTPPRDLNKMAREREERRAKMAEEALKVQEAIARQEAGMKKLSRESEPQGV